jgi:2-iminobutanoate/2-iminopropanoate deaminase
MKKLLSFLLFLMAVVSSQAQNNIEKKKFHFGAEQDTANGYVQALKVDNVIYISGTVATDITEKDITRVYKVIEKSLEPFGATLQNVVKETVYTTNIEAMKSFNQVRKALYKGDYPAATWVQISRLFMPEAKLEIEVIAHLKK